MFSNRKTREKASLETSSRPMVIGMIRRTTEEPSQEFVPLWHFFVFLDSRSERTPSQHVASIPLGVYIVMD